MRRLLNILVVLFILVLFLVSDVYLINKVFAISPPASFTSWVKALPLQPNKRSVYVEWSSVSGASGYFLEVANSPFSTNNPTNFVVIYQGTAVSYTHKNLSDNYWYTYRARAYDNNNVNSAYTTAHGVAIQPAGLKWEETY